MSATAAKLPIIRNSGRVASWLLPRKPVTSVEAAASDGIRPMNSDEAITPTMPMIAAIGISTSVISHITTNTMVTVSPTCACAQDEIAAKSSIAHRANAAQAKVTTAAPTMPASPSANAARTSLMMMTLCTSVPNANRKATLYMNGACGRLRMTVVRCSCASAPA